MIKRTNCSLAFLVVPFVVLLPAAVATSATDAVTESSEPDSNSRPTRQALRSLNQTETVTLPQTTLTTYQYDDNDFESRTYVFFEENYYTNVTAWENELAQRFTLSRSGTAKWVEVCLGNEADSTMFFDFVVYVRGEFTGLPGFAINRTPSGTVSLSSRTNFCHRVAVSNVQLDAGSIWVSVEWTPRQADKGIVLMVDQSTRQGKRAFRGKKTKSSNKTDWHGECSGYDGDLQDYSCRYDSDRWRGPSFGIRLGVEHSTGAQPTGSSTLHGGQFGLTFQARANGSTIGGKAADWSSKRGVLYSLFDADNPEALVKVLDGRITNGHWWLDVAVTSDLYAWTLVTHRVTGKTWRVVTGLGKDVFKNPGDRANRLTHCAYPADRTDNRCAVWGAGTTISLRNAWNASGRIPAGYYN